MKKILVSIVALTMLIALVLTGCAPAEQPASPAPSQASSAPAVESKAPESQAPASSSAAPAAKKKIGVVMIDLVNPFYVNMMEAGNEAAKDFDVEVIWKSADGSLEKEISLIENFIGQVDCILCDPLDAKALVPVIEKVGKSGTPIVTMGNFVDTAYNVSTMYNDFNDTKVIAKTLANLVGKKGKVALIYGNDGNFCSDQRKAGFLEGMKEFPDITVISQPSNWDSATGLKAAQDILAANPDLVGIHVVSDGVTMSVMQLTKGTKIELTSYDGNKEASEQVKAGVIKLDLLTGARRVGYWNVKVGWQLANGEKMDQKQYLSSYFVANDDMKAKMTEWGLTDGIKIITPDQAIKQFDDFSDMKK